MDKTPKEILNTKCIGIGVRLRKGTTWAYSEDKFFEFFDFNNRCGVVALGSDYDDHLNRITTTQYMKRAPNGWYDSEQKRECDIMEIFEFNVFKGITEKIKTLWERKEEKEMTIAEIEKELGYKIKIVGGK